MWGVSFTAPGLSDVIYTEAPNSVVARAIAETVFLEWEF